MSYRERIVSARKAGEEWVVLEEGGDGTTQPSRWRRLEMHVLTGIAILSTEEDRDGETVFRTETFFLRRETGEPLPCGSRRWNQMTAPDRNTLEEKVQQAKADVYRRFGGLVRAARRSSAASQASSSEGT